MNVQKWHIMIKLNSSRVLESKKNVTSGGGEEDVFPGGRKESRTQKHGKEGEHHFWHIKDSEMPR